MTKVYCGLTWCTHRAGDGLCTARLIRIELVDPAICEMVTHEDSLRVKARKLLGKTCRVGRRSSHPAIGTLRGCEGEFLVLLDEKTWHLVHRKDVESIEEVA
ncbi:MAG: hypothetical protein GTO63_23520 [Anaerolineae bacterium]|nr:hypothetical protein [Anaerolineae bacterium]NIN97700.1 hypothetical protein [Anaerolineae bacterium]NIQ80685.1 hypothetical protein [Anaerolineae bacterium]